MKNQGAIVFQNLLASLLNQDCRFGEGGAGELLVPAKAPKPIIDRLQREVAAVLALAQVRERYLKSGFEPVGNKPEEFAQQIKTDLARWNKVVKESNIKIE